MFRIFLIIFVFVLLTLLTQVGGLVYLLAICIPVSRLSKFFIFVVLYAITTYAIVPMAAKETGRVQVSSTFISTFLNRNYVNPDLKAVIVDLEDVNCLEANFPFINGFPLFPHLSHNDGNKLDIAFRYIDKRTNKKTDDIPSWNGYGIYEEPLPHEVNMPAECDRKGKWQYSVLHYLTPQSAKAQYKIDLAATKALILKLAANPSVKKIFLEPHLKSRMALQIDKIRYQGCRAVRHDDHIHIEI